MTQSIGIRSSSQPSFERMTEGMTLRKIGQELGLSASTIIPHCHVSPEFDKQYARAKQVQMESMAEEIMEIADSASPESYNPRRLQVDTRKWLMSKLVPSRYGEKLEHSGPDGGPIQIVSTIPRPPKE